VADSFVLPHYAYYLCTVIAKTDQATPLPAVNTGCRVRSLTLENTGSYRNSGTIRCADVLRCGICDAATAVVLLLGLVK
jgi:hypothetical protein